jgi:hypothetical protein
MADQPNRDREAEQTSRDIERRHQDAIQAMARKNADVQAKARQARRASEERKIAMHRQSDEY